MMDLRYEVRIEGRLRGERLEGAGTLAIADDAIHLATEEGERPRGVCISYASLEGATWRDPRLELWLDAGDVVCLVGATPLGDVAARIVELSCALPELTLALRGLGSRRAHPGADHDRFFAALLHARRELEAARSMAARLGAFEGRGVRAATERVIAELAAERFAQLAPDRRALEAELLECAERLFAQLALVDEAAATVRAAGDATRVARWREWALAVRDAFGAADRCWLAAVPVLESVPPSPTPTRGWRRVRRGR